MGCQLTLDRGLSGHVDLEVWPLAVYIQPVNFMQQP